MRLSTSWINSVLVRQGIKMGKKITLKEFYDDPSIKLINLLDEIEKLKTYELWSKKELELLCEKEPNSPFCYKGEFLNECVMCDGEFDYSDKIFIEKTPSLMDDPEYYFGFFHEDCLKYYLEHNDDDIDQATIDAYEFPTNICQFCGVKSDKDLPYTDGKGYFCEECAPLIPGTYKKE
jgi:hypothetical protein